MADSRIVSGNMAVEQDSKYRVAYHLAEKISLFEQVDKAKPRRYWLELYHQCLHVVSFEPVPNDIQERPDRS